MAYLGLHESASGKWLEFFGQALEHVERFEQLLPDSRCICIGILALENYDAVVPGHGKEVDH